jgi:hypothetical protein
MGKQFHTKAKAKEFYDVAIKQWGSERASRYLAVTRIIPKSWRYVRVWKQSVNENEIILKIECLYKAEEGVQPNA